MSMRAIQIGTINGEPLTLVVPKEVAIRFDERMKRKYPDGLPEFLGGGHMDTADAGRKGGQQRSEAQQLARKRNMLKALAKRHPQSVKIQRDLYDVARDVCHEHGLPWTDPRTLITYPPPKEKR